MDGVIVDTLWVLIAGILVFFMQTGFAMVESGFTQAKNTANIIMKNFMDFGIGTLMFWFVGFSIMFGAGNGFFGTFEFFGNVAGDFGIPTYAFLFFQTTFAATAATIVSGAVAGRMKFGSYLIISLIITTVIYPISGHWVWGGGWLAELGFVDFAGSSVVHGLGGFAALASAAILGPRIGKYNADGTANEIPGHSLIFGALGVFILWLGWFGFNPGSQLAASTVEDIEAISLIFMTTNVAAAAGAVGAMLITMVKNGHADVGVTLNGALAGLVGITAGTAAVTPMSALFIGLISSVVVVFGLEFIEKTLKIDDPVGAISVHGLCGFTGTILVGLFAVDGGLFYGGGMSLLIVQVVGALAIAVWGFGSAFLLFKAIDVTVGLRVSPEEEEQGLDLSEHQTDTYPDFVYVEK